jgi:hypothetical protein
MLGELIGQGAGKRAYRKVVSTNPTNIEVSFESNGAIFGVQVLEIGTYNSTIRPDGSLYGEGAGILMTQDGEEITWKGGGIGSFREGGTVAYRGAIYYYSKAERFTRLNKVAAVFEFESDMQGNTQSKVWEWK